MSTSVYPTLPGLSFGVQREVLAPPVTIRTSPSRREYRSRNATSPLYLYTLQYEFLRSGAAWAELQTLLGFYNARGGPFDSFLFTDPDDNQVAAQSFGTGNGSTAAWQLVRSYGGFAEPVLDTNGAPQIYVNGTLQTVFTHYTLPGNGVVQFNTAPGAGALLTWTGSFYRRCRFEGDRISTSKFMQDLWEAKRVQLLSLKV